MRQILTELYYGHTIQVDFTTTPEGEELEFIPDSVKEVIGNKQTDILKMKIKSK